MNHFVSDSTDCNDELPYPQGVYFYYTDTDSDGYGDPGSGFESCTDLGNAFVVNGDDCDVNDPLQPALYFFDGDNDGYGGAQSSLICGNDDPQWITQGGDCDDFLIRRLIPAISAVIAVRNPLYLSEHINMI